MTSLIEKIGGCKRIIAVLTTLTVLGMFVLGRVVPQEILGVWLMIVSLYYGQSIANGKK